LCRPEWHEDEDILGKVSPVREVGKASPPYFLSFGLVLMVWRVAAVD
jgi:hypothetical protein